jgi:hypothetical protein
MQASVDHTTDRNVFKQNTTLHAFETQAHVINIYTELLARKTMCVALGNVLGLNLMFSSTQHLGSYSFVHKKVKLR